MKRLLTLILIVLSFTVRADTLSYNKIIIEDTVAIMHDVVGQITICGDTIKIGSIHCKILRITKKGVYKCRLLNTNKRVDVIIRKYDGLTVTSIYGFTGNIYYVDFQESYYTKT